MAARKPYRQWLKDHLVELEALPAPPSAPAVNGFEPFDLLKQQQAFGYTLEELKMLMAPMAANGQEAVGSMGTDTPLAVLSDKSPLLFNYFKQLFAQVTNPPVDPIREEMVMSAETTIGSEQNLFEETALHCRQLRLKQPILTNVESAKDQAAGPAGPAHDHAANALSRGGWRKRACDRALDELVQECVGAIKEGIHANRPVGSRRQCRMGADSEPARDRRGASPSDSRGHAHALRPDRRIGRAARSDALLRC